MSWFPQRERARANSVYSVGMYFGIAFLSPLLFWIVQTYSWRVLFGLVGAIGIVFAGVWYWLYRDPHESRWANKAELDLIAEGGIVTPIVIGFVVASTGSFFGGLGFIGVVALIGALSYIFVVGEVVRIEDRRAA